MTDTAAAVLLAIWLRSLTMVAFVNLATAKKDGCAKNGPNTDHTWESIGDTDHGCAKNGPNTDHTWESIGDTDHTWESIGDRHRRSQRHQT